MRNRLLLIALLSLCLAPTSLWAADTSLWLAQANQPKPSDDASKQDTTTIQGKTIIRWKKVTRHSFTGVRVDGKQYGPPGRAYTAHRKPGFNSMIRYRNDFAKELWRQAKNM